MTISEDTENVVFNGNDCDYVVWNGTTIWQKVKGFVPFTLGKADGLIFAYNTIYLKGAWDTNKNAFAFAAAGSSVRDIVVPIEGYKYHSMPATGGANSYGKTYINTHTLLNVPKGCKKITLTWTKTTYDGYYSVTLNARNTEGSISKTSSTGQHSLSIDITFEEESWLIVRVNDYQVTTPEGVLGNDYVLSFE